MHYEAIWKKLAHLYVLNQSQRHDTEGITQQGCSLQAIVSGKVGGKASDELEGALSAHTFDSIQFLCVASMKAMPKLCEAMIWQMAFSFDNVFDFV